MPMLAEQVEVVIGVDTHKETHTAAVIAANTGAELEILTVTTDRAGYEQLVELADAHSARRAWAIEGVGGYGAGLNRVLRPRGEHVIELDRPRRPPRRNGAKDDAIDAARAGREALAREHLAQPRADGNRAALALLLTGRRSAVDASRVAQQQLRALIITAPELLRDRFRDLGTRAAIPAIARLRISPKWDLETRTTAGVLRDLARRIQALQAEADTHEQAMTAIINGWRPDLLDQPGVGTISAAIVLCAWSHPGRCRNEGAFAKLAGVAPIPASSGATTRHRLNRSGDRQLNRAIHTIAITRLRVDPATRAYTERRRSEGRTNREIRRCLKRYIARQLYRQLETGTPTTT